MSKEVTKKFIVQYVEKSLKKSCYSMLTKVKKNGMAYYIESFCGKKVIVQYVEKFHEKNDAKKSSKVTKNTVYDI